MMKQDEKVLNMLKEIKAGNNFIDDFAAEIVKRGSRLGFVHPKIKFSRGILVATDKGKKFLGENIHEISK